jgi:precorrin-6B methylase 2
VTLKSVAKRALFGVAPKLAVAIISARARAHSHRLVKKWGLFAINQKLIREVGSTVLAGPFRGLRLPASTYDEHIGPYLLGTYEMELHPWWNEILTRQFEMIVDVGAKFGYYAVGLAQKFPSVPTVAFDTDRWARRVTAQTAAANEVANVTILGYCTPEWLATQLKPKSFIISDCEGFEGELFGAGDNGVLETATMLIELHDQIVPGVTAKIEQRFSRTHTFRRVRSRTATPVTANIHVLTAEELRRAATEIRRPQEWVYLEPSDSSAPVSSSL